MMKKSTLAWFAGAWLCGGATVPAQNPDAAAKAARLDAVAKSYTAGNAFMGTVLVVEGERTLLDKGYGSADLEWDIPNAPDVRFRLGS